MFSMKISSLFREICPETLHSYHIIPMQEQSFVVVDSAL